MSARETLRTLVDALGADPDAAAQTLIAQDCRGLPGTSDACPIAVWLGRQGVDDPIVTDLEVTAGDVTIYTSEAVREFVHLFDGGLWPELVQP